MIKGFVTLIKGILFGRKWVLIWILWLILLHGFVPLFFLPSIEAIWILVTFALSTLTMSWLTGRFGFTRILGISHAWWLLAWVVIIGRFSQYQQDARFYQWIIILLITDVIALAFDGWDIWRYFRGDKEEIE